MPHRTCKIQYGAILRCMERMKCPCRVDFPLSVLNVFKTKKATIQHCRTLNLHDDYTLYHMRPTQTAHRLILFYRPSIRAWKNQGGESTSQLNQKTKEKHSIGDKPTQRKTTLKAFNKDFICQSQLSNAIIENVSKNKLLFGLRWGHRMMGAVIEVVDCFPFE